MPHTETQSVPDLSRVEVLTLSEVAGDEKGTRTVFH